ncbi:MAG: helicase-related protein [Propionibacteriaceae bacterium]
MAFILMNLDGLASPESPDRQTADLLWFPTGGGKTEAYLGLIGFTILLRRLRNSGDAGVSVLMRYTLRLLTLQQFERAAGLICALESLRRVEMPDSKEISLGLWVGQAATPNNLKDARAALRKLERGETVHEGNPMQLTRCPWCGADLKPKDYVPRSFPVERLAIICPTLDCEFHGGVPAHVIDADVYAARPSLVIGTVDKFAMMAWNASTQHLFSADGKYPKPDLIVQDELHLISGPLGTMVGLYEIAVDAACSTASSRPKLIASTATIRRATQQVQSVFARGTRQFPPPGLDADDSFFSVDADRATTGDRLYVGVMAQGVTHTYLLVRTYAALLQAGRDLDATDDVRDAYWTLMGYFNSLRVLGGAAIQVDDDVPAQMRVIAQRHGTRVRTVDQPAELTSRIASSDIPNRLRELAQEYGGEKVPLDVVLATNMISVGLDVDRLGLMAVMGQPQATAEYIQATSRVGRSNPGLVVVIYNSTRSRDLSHYESFSSYHRALYRQVEPNSATPFSPRARDRGLHGCLVAFARNTQMTLNPDAAAGSVGDHPEALDPVIEAIVKRAEASRSPDHTDAARTELGRVTRRQLEELVSAWSSAAATGQLKYAGWRTPVGALLVRADATMTDTDKPPTFPVSTPAWATLTSLRDVDAVSSLYIISEKGTHA